MFLAHVAVETSYTDKVEGDAVNGDEEKGCSNLCTGAKKGNPVYTAQVHVCAKRAVDATQACIQKKVTHAKIHQSNPKPLFSQCTGFGTSGICYCGRGYHQLTGCKENYLRFHNEFKDTAWYKAGPPGKGRSYNIITHPEDIGEVEGQTKGKLTCFLWLLLVWKDNTIQRCDASALQSWHGARLFGNGRRTSVRPTAQ